MIVPSGVKATIASTEDCTSAASSAVARSASFSAVTSSQTPTIRSGSPRSSRITSPCMRMRKIEPSGRVQRLTSENGWWSATTLRLRASTEARSSGCTRSRKPA